MTTYKNPVKIKVFILVLLPLKYRLSTVSNYFLFSSDVSQKTPIPLAIYHYNNDFLLTLKKATFYDLT